MRHLIISCLVILLAVIACNLPVQTRLWPTPPTATPSPTARPIESVTRAASPPVIYTPEAPPLFEAAPCAFPIPAGTNPECGYLIVPENRSRVGSRSIRLHVARFRSHAANPAPDPVIHLAGGPGSSSLAVARYLFSYGMGAVLEERDLILFDQRGTGYSEPRLDCPERQEITPWLLAGGLTWEVKESAILDAFHRCRERLLAEGVDLAGYTSAQSAADVNDLSRALGVAQVNLYGVSYGTRLALTVMRDFPAIVRSAVLDSAYPPQVNLYTALAPNAGRAFSVFFRRCDQDTTCSAAYPSLEATFYELVDHLNAVPAQVELETSGDRYTIAMDGGLLIDVLLVGLYNPAVAATMPRMIDEIRQGEYSILRERLKLYFDDSGALGMNLAVQCNEEIPFSTPEEAFTAANATPPQIAAFFPYSVRPLFTACREWAALPLDDRENQPVRSDVPALILAGEVDPITPPEWGRAAAQSLRHSTFFELPGNGHWVTRSSPCALQMALAFWLDPTAPVQNRCEG